MTTPVTDHPLVQRYLQALDRLLVDLEPSERAEIVEGVRDHLADDLADDAGSEDVQAALARVGPVEAIAEEATRGRPVRRQLPGRPVPFLARGWVPVAARVLQLLALFFVLVVAMTYPTVDDGPSYSQGPDGTLVQSPGGSFDGGYGDLLLPALFASLPWWPVLALLVGLSPLWTTWEWVRTAAAVPVVALLLDVAPVLGWQVAGPRGMTVAGVTALVLSVPLWGYVVWWLPHLARLRVELFRARAAGA